MSKYNRKSNADILYFRNILKRSFKTAIHRLRKAGRGPIKVNAVHLFSPIILIVIAATVIVYFQLNKLKESELRESFRTLQKQVMEIKLSSHEFLFKERNNLLFFSLGESEYIDRYQSAYKKYQQCTQNIKDQLFRAGVSETTELDKLEENMKAYDILFVRIILGIKERGIDDYGVIGDFGVALRKISRFDYGTDNISLLRLKYFIQEYQLSGSVKTIQQVDEETYRFSTQLEKYISDVQVEEVIHAISDYESNFKKLVSSDSTLGLYSGKGLQEKLFAQMHSIDKILPLTKTEDQISTLYTGFFIKTMSCLAVAFLLIGLLIIKIRERELRITNRELEAKVLERTLEIQERAMQLEKKNKALEGYAFMTAHNLRAPVARILGLVNLISKTQRVNEDEKIIVDYLQNSAEDLDTIIHSIARAVETSE